MVLFPPEEYRLEKNRIDLALLEIVDNVSGKNRKKKNTAAPFVAVIVLLTAIAGLSGYGLWYWGKPKPTPAVIKDSIPQLYPHIHMESSGAGKCGTGKRLAVIHHLS